MADFIPYICKGEIIEVQKPIPGDANVVRYRCLVTLKGGAMLPIPNVIEASIFGGIGDYFRQRSRSRKDAEFPNQTINSADWNASVGERVYISFVNGNILQPVIIGYAQHPNQTVEIEDPTSEEPQMVFQKLGFRWSIDDKGQTRFTHKGAPEVSFAPESAFGSLPAFNNSGIPGEGNPALSATTESNVCVLEFLDKGIFRARDYKGGIFELDHNKNRVYISNNDITSLDDPDGVSLNISGDSTDAEFVLLDRDKELLSLNARSLVKIHSNDGRADTTDGKYQHAIGGDSVWTIGGNQAADITGNSDTSVGGSYSNSVTGGYNLSVGGKLVLDTKSAFQASAGGKIEFSSGAEISFVGTGSKLTLGQGKVALGAGAVELLDLIAQLMTNIDSQLTNIQALTVVGNFGYPTSVPVNTPAFVINQTQLNQIKALLESIKGSL